VSYQIDVFNKEPVSLVVLKVRSTTFCHQDVALSSYTSAWLEVKKLIQQI
jgi:hypothetical protein